MRAKRRATPGFWRRRGLAVQCSAATVTDASRLYLPHMRPLNLALLLSVLAGLGACTAPVNRSLCEGFQTRARIVDPLADQKTMRNPASCEDYAAQRDRLLPQRPQ
jgi:hypothetical protein